MGIVIGIDEAGLGPNFGPFVVTAVAWEVPGDPLDVDLWSLLADVVCNNPATTDGRIVLGDSKLLFQPHRGLSRLEVSVLRSLDWAGLQPRSVRELRQQLRVDDTLWDRVPWLQSHDLNLPADALPPFKAPPSLPDGVQLRAVRSRMVDALEFNELLQRGNKSQLVTQCHFELLRRLCDEFPDTPILVVSDKHGGRNFYASALCAAWDGAWVETVQESPQRSVYRLKSLEIRFQPRAEEHLPVALASMTCKYLRELEMRLFNQFWQTHLPGLPPTQGYPLDARRFLAAIAPICDSLRLHRSLLWREK